MVYVCCLLIILIRMVAYIVGILLLNQWTVLSISADVKEYCQPEFFDETCGPDEVILMQSAQYGRVQVGRCVKGNYGYLGCSLNVLSYMDSMCSGRRSCKFRIFDSKLREINPCPEDINPYLEASHTCIKVQTAEPSDCNTLHHIPVALPTGYLASVETEENSYGTMDCPWALKSKEGQIFKLYLLNFAKLTEEMVQLMGCYEMAEITEDGGTPQSVTTCDGEDRQRPFYESTSNQIQIKLVGPATLENLGTFLIRYEVSGCPDIRTPANATVTRNKEDLSIKCHNNEQTWYLVCKGRTWIGEVGNCTFSESSSTEWHIGNIFQNAGFPYGDVTEIHNRIADPLPRTPDMPQTSHRC